MLEMSVKGTAGSQGTEPGRSQWPRERVAKPNSFLGSTSSLLRRVGKSLGPAAGVGHPRAFAAPSFPRGLAGPPRIGEVGSRLILAQPLEQREPGEEMKPAHASVCTRNAPTDASLNPPTRASVHPPGLAHASTHLCTLTSTDGCASTACARTCRCPLARPARTNPASMFSSRGAGGKDAAHQAACISGLERCLLLPTLSLPDLTHRDLDAAPPLLCRPSPGWAAPGGDTAKGIGDRGEAGVRLGVFPSRCFPSAGGKFKRIFLCGPN